MLVAWAAPIAVAAIAPPEVDWVQPDLERDGFGYPVGRLTFRYPIPHPDLPDLAELTNVTVVLTPTSDGYIGPVPGAPTRAVGWATWTVARPSCCTAAP
jgi:hypothetical protein